MRLLLLTLALAACTPDASAPAAAVPDAPAEAPAPPDADDDLAARAAAAGLSEAQAQQLVDLGMPIVVPSSISRWEFPRWSLADFSAEAEEYDGFRYPFYRLAYRSVEGTCFTLEAASEGVGDVFMDEPPYLRHAAVRVAAYGPVIIGAAGEGEVDDTWEVPYTRTEWFGADGLAISLASETRDGCQRITPEEAVGITYGLRYLDPADDALALGPLAFVDLADPFVGDLANGPTPEDAVAQVFAQTEGEGATATAVEVLRRRPQHAVVLVTKTNLPDDSVRDERVRAVVRPGDEGWLMTEAGRQVRCREGRGHAEWGPEPCL